ncbi:MAG: DnaJ domain-containing protein [Vicinamibacteria bacterium]|nr:DnaJ domain-containing protein [Vicinamibacteria bacterium]
MKFKDYYEILGVQRTATPDQIKAAYRRLARKYHPDVSKEANAEARFKELGEAHEVLKDPEKRALYDRMGSQWKSGQDFKPAPGWDAGFEFRGGDETEGFGDPNDFFEAFFGRRPRGGSTRRSNMHAQGEDHHAKVMIDLEDAYRGAQRSISLRMPSYDAHGQLVMHERQLDVSIPKGIRAGQHLRLTGQGGPGVGKGPAGNLYLEVGFNPHPRFRVDDRDVFVGLDLAPWEAALGAKVETLTPDGPVQLTIPQGSAAGRQMRLKGKGIPGQPPGDLYVVLAVSLPPADTEAAKEAYRAMSRAFSFDPRRERKG